jgi:DNA primase
LQDRDFRELIERVKLRTPIEVVVGERVPELTRRGSAWKARCPFHDEKTPSFVVNPERGTWRCFGACAEGGDVIAFVQRFEGLSFFEALRMLAQACGEAIPETFRRRESQAEDAGRRRLYEAMERAERLYARFLFSDDGAQALEYARGRGLTDATLKAFGVGFAPRWGSPLGDAAAKSGFSEDVLVEAGLMRRAGDAGDAGAGDAEAGGEGSGDAGAGGEPRRGRVYDFFRGRLMIPIRDQVGRTVGFGGRQLPGDEHGGPKYVNTAETALFKKSRLIYGLDRALSTVRRTKHLVLMEGYTDVMAAHQVGLANAAAVLGTATTSDHAALVRRSGAKRVTLVFDGDAAGLRAGLRAVEHLLPLGIELDVAVLPSGTDPCDLCIAAGGDAFRARLDGAIDWYSHALESLSGLSGPRLAEEVDEILKLLLMLPKRVERDVRVAEMARFLGIPEAGIREQGRELSRRQRGVRRAPLAPAAPAAPEPAEAAAPPLDPRLVRAFETMLGAALLDPSLLPQIRGRREACPAGALRLIFDALLALWDEDDDDSPIDDAAVINALGADPARDRVVGLADAARSAESPQVLVRDQLAWLDRRMREREIQRSIGDIRADGGLEAPSTRAAAHRLYEELRGMKVPKRPSKALRENAGDGAAAAPSTDQFTSPTTT